MKTCYLSWEWQSDELEIDLICHIELNCFTNVLCEQYVSVVNLFILALKGLWIIMSAIGSMLWSVIAILLGVCA